jgi:hypothetical protein
MEGWDLALPSESRYAHDRRAAHRETPTGSLRFRPNAVNVHCENPAPCVAIDAAARALTRLFCMARGLASCAGPSRYYGDNEISPGAALFSR